MNRPTDHFIGTGGGANPNDCSVVTADGKVISMAGDAGEALPATKREKARERVVEEHKKEEKEKLPVKLNKWDDILDHIKPFVVSDAHFIVVPDQEEGTAWFFPTSNTYFIASTDWTDLCEYGMNWWAERSEQMAYINEDLPSPYDDPALEPLLGMVRPKIVGK
jgi:hypothetical protein|tara:strand:+ start:2594 stop:3085 length:492 start_codon:yes stop_codon:yes gene_type:complete